MYEGCQAHAPALRKAHLIFKKQEYCRFLTYDCDLVIHLTRELDIPHIALIHELNKNSLTVAANLCLNKSNKLLPVQWGRSAKQNR